MAGSSSPSGCSPLACALARARGEGRDRAAHVSCGPESHRLHRRQDLGPVRHHQPRRARRGLRRADGRTRLGIECSFELASARDTIIENAIALLCRTGRIAPGDKLIGTTDILSLDRLVDSVQLRTVS
jgi:hypothetical protein